jgi:hypothetical protein
MNTTVTSLHRFMPPPCYQLQKIKAIPEWSFGSHPWDTPTSYQIATEVTLTQIGIQATASYLTVT